jgi:hypothetical protein
MTIKEGVVKPRLKQRLMKCSVRNREATFRSCRASPIHLWLRDASSCMRASLSDRRLHKPPGIVEEIAQRLVVIGLLDRDRLESIF